MKSQPLPALTQIIPARLTVVRFAAALFASVVIGLVGIGKGVAGTLVPEESSAFAKPRLSIQPTSDNDFELKIEGPLRADMVLQFSSDLKEWTTLETLPQLDHPTRLSHAPLGGHGYYRLFNPFSINAVDQGVSQTLHIPQGLSLGKPRERPRVLITTDIGGSDPDDFQSLVHLLVYADMLEIQGLVSSPIPNRSGSVRDIFEVIDAYEKDLSKLNSYSSGPFQYPMPSALRGIVTQGRSGLTSIKPGSASSAGSRWIVKTARQSDPRPLYVLAWGGLHDVAQALHDAPDIADKIRLYSIGSWNTQNDPNPRKWIYENRPDLWWIESDSTFRGMYLGGPSSGALSNVGFPQTHVAKHGALGRLFFGKQKVLKMGDTPSVLFLIYGSQNPSQPSWGGQYQKEIKRKNYWEDREDNSIILNGVTYRGAKTVSRWRTDYLKDFARRMDRCVQTKANP